MDDGEYDPLADFLATERAALGEDADMFQADMTSSSSPAPAAGIGASGDNDMDVDTFMASSTSFVADTAMSPSFNASASASASASLTPSAQFSPSAQFTAMDIQSPSDSPSQQQQQTGFQQEWQSHQREIISERDRDSETKHQRLVREAQESVDKFYAEYNEKKERAIAQNRAGQEVEMQTALKGNLWERVLKQIDLATKSAAADQRGVLSPLPTANASASASASASVFAGDTARMRELLQDLKKDKDAPGVKSKKPITA
ncbi:Clathrin light chain [Kickxella alabastrina]|uniref:Clathrin light chain n=1 Tax=Kickxella alabastrina TaxID=61397 RepID=A0ACC1I3X3_9FUNG|nr:Clathrin light chain [Kickxella alabastrina]